MTDEANEFGTGEFGGQMGAGNSSDMKTLISDVLKTTGVGTNNTRYRETALAFGNQVYLTILKGRHWKFMNKELFMDVLPPHTPGTVQATPATHSIKAEEGTALTAFNSNHKGQMLAVAAQEEYYRVIDVISGTELQIHSRYVGDAVTDATYKIVNDRILLDSKVQDIRSLSVVGHREIKPVGLQQFRTRKETYPTQTGTPDSFTVIGERAQDGSQLVEIYPAPDKRYSIFIEYTERPMRLEDSETCFLVIPPEHMDVMILGMRAKIYQDQNNEAMARVVGAEAAQAWNRMAGDQEITDSRARLQPGRNYFHRNRGSRFKGYYGLKHFGKVD